MSNFKFIETKIKDLIIVEPSVYGDERGYFMEAYHKKDFYAGGIKTEFVQDNVSFSTRGVLRGLHFQTKNTQGKLVRVISGSVYDVAVDLRRDSETYGKWEGVILNDENKRQFYVPEGFAHGFLVLSETALFTYKCTNYYSPEYDSGIMWNDKDLNIDWMLKDVDEIKLSEKDKIQMSFESFSKSDVKF